MTHSAAARPSIHLLSEVKAKAAVIQVLLAVCFASALPLQAEILWQHPKEILTKDDGQSMDILKGAVAPHDDTSSGTLYFRFRVDPLSDAVYEIEAHQPYAAGLVWSVAGKEKLGLGNARDGWGYSAFCSSFPAGATNKAGELTLRTNHPVQQINPWLAPRRGVRTTIVCKVDYVPGGDDSVTVWLAPDLATGASEWSQSEAIVTRFRADASFDQLRTMFRGPGDGWMFDEIAVATSFTDFIPQSWWQRGWVISLAVMTGTCLMIVIAVSLERRRTRERIRKMEREQAIAAERGRIARDLHDDIGSRVTEILLRGEVAKSASRDPERQTMHVTAMVSELRDLHATLDEVVWSINPRHDSLTDLVDFVSESAERFTHNASVEFHLEVSRNLPPVTVSSVTRHNFVMAVKEALHNAVRHANAKTIRLIFRVDEGCLHARVVDDGCGMTDTGEGAGDGLRNMRARMATIGGSTEIHSAPGEGTQVIFRVPLQFGRSGVASPPKGRKSENRIA